MKPLRFWKRAWAGTSVIAAALACAMVTSPLATSEVAQPLAPSVDGHPLEFGSPDLTMEYLMETAGIAERIAATGEFELRVAPSSVRLALEEFEIFLPGERKVVELDAQGTVVRETPYTGRLFRGNVSGGEGTAFVLVAPEGLYGVIDTPSAQYSLQPASSGLEPAGWILQQISVAPRDPSGWVNRATDDSPTGSSDVTYDLHVKAWADAAYKNYASDYANRITSAYGYVANMWLSETSIYVGLYAITSLGFNFGYTNTCAGVSDSGLQNFRDTWVNFNSDLDPGAGVIYANSYALFTASANPGNGIGGCGGSRLSRNAPFGYEPQSTHTVQGKDWTIWDTYDPDETAHRGLAAGHELTHNGGSGGHPGDGWPCNYNIMANGVPFQCKWAWRTAGTIADVNAYAPGRLA